MKLILLGSCVTRDIFGPKFENGWNDIHISMSFNRSSLISLMSEPFNLDLSSNPNLNPYERRALSDDLNKNFFKYLSRLKYDGHYLLIDFIEERFNIFSFTGKYATVSNEFLKSAIAGTMDGKILGRQSEEAYKLWEQGCLFLIREINAIFPASRIILHKAYWMSEYIDNGKTVLFPNQEEISRHNSMLEKYYSFFEYHCPGIAILDISSKGYKADLNHQWGLGAMHYEKGYYGDCMNFLLTLQ
jgi:hypothetical protein